MIFSLFTTKEDDNEDRANKKFFRKRTTHNLNAVLPSKNLRKYKFISFFTFALAAHYLSANRLIEIFLFHSPAVPKT